MTVIDVRKDPAAKQMIVTTEFDADVERVWQVWADPRKLERWWGPPSHPATVVDHDLSAGGSVTYFMTGPEGEKYHGYWTVVSVDAPSGFSFVDGFADDDGNPNDELPTTETRIALLARDGGGTRMIITSTFASAEAMEQLIAMGVEEGIKQALGQIDALV